MDHIEETLQTCLQLCHTTCSCGRCERCQHQTFIQAAIDARQTERKLIAAVREALPAAPATITAALALLEGSHG